MSARILTLPAFAKINLLLRVLGRREDGFHELLTIFQTIDLHDRITFEAVGGGRIELSCAEPGVPLDESNLVVRAARLLQKRAGTGLGARINLEKRIPVGGGLGGGSSDAAVTLLGLSQLWKIGATPEELTTLGASLGADVPFFFTGGTALGTGLGTEIAPRPDLRPQSLVIVSPGVSVSTSGAYKALGAPALTKEDGAVMLPISRADDQLSDSFCEVMRNDFEPVIFRLYPEIERARAALLDAGARRAMMSGSGSSVFGLFENERQAGGACEVLRRGEPRWRAFACATLSRGEYREALGACAALM